MGTTTRVVTFGAVEDKVRQQIEACQHAEDGAPAVLCGDNHLGYSMPIGGVVGYERLISPSAVGYDIACGNAAVRTDVLATDLDVSAAMDLIWRELSFGMGRKNAQRVDHPVLEEIATCAFKVQRDMVKTAADQLGTIGGGNHYVDLFVDDADGRLWIGVHFGSRGFGHKTATWALEQAGATNDDMMAPPVTIPIASDLGQAYIDGMERAGRYAYAGRDWVVDRVLSLLGATAIDRIHHHHNFAWREEHGGRALWVHRKGATPAFPGQRGFVGGTMGEPAVILEGVDADMSVAALYSTVHGAGRVMSRTKAAGKSARVKHWKCGNRACARHEHGWPLQEFARGPGDQLPRCPACGGKLHPNTSFVQVAPGLVDFDAVQARVKAQGIELRGAGADEAPECYKRLTDVLAHHTGTIRVLHTLRPIGVAMAGKDVFDPFRD